MTKETEQRIEKLYNLGLIYNGKSFTYKGINFHRKDVISMTDQEFTDTYQAAIFRMSAVKAKGPQWRRIEGIERLFFDRFHLKDSAKLLVLRKYVILQGTNDQGISLICIYDGSNFFSVPGSYSVDSIKLLLENNFIDTIKGLNGLKTYQNGV